MTRTYRFWTGGALLLAVVVLAAAGYLFLRPHGAEEEKPEPGRTIPAFPTAHGFGAFAKGGRGGKVVEVTNLNARGPGSFRAAVIDTKGPRTVVFRVSGIIDLQREDFSVKDPYLTIAGQTAPADGITVKGGFVSIQTHDVVIRDIRFRPGPGGWPAQMRSGGSGDGFAFTATQVGTVGTAILDHVSISWSTDETLGIAGPVTNVTVQNSILSEAMNCVPPPFQWGERQPCSSKHLLMGGSKAGTPDKFSFHHNLLADGLERNPVIHSGEVDWVNNVVSNWGIPMVVAPDNGPIRLNVIGNYYRAGIGKKSRSYRNTVYSDGEFLLATECLREHTPCEFSGSSAVYIPELVRPDDPHRNLATDPGTGGPFVARTTCRPTGRCLVHVPLPFGFPALPTTSAEEAYVQVLDRSGATLPRRDPVDARVVSNVRNGMGGVIDTPDQVGSYPPFHEIQSEVADSDHDGMPNDWEKRHDLDPGKAQDRNGDFNGDGYTNLEKYLNELAGDGPPATAK